MSSYVANTLPASFSLPAKGYASPSSPAFPPNASSPYYYPVTQGSGNTILGNHQDNVCVLNTGDVVQFSAFDWIETAGSSRSRSSRYVQFFYNMNTRKGPTPWEHSRASPTKENKPTATRQTQLRGFSSWTGIGMVAGGVCTYSATTALSDCSWREKHLISSTCRYLG
jgi:hypothetical protein